MDAYKKMKILIVDDDIISIDLLQSILAKKGYQEIKTSTSAKDVLESVFNEPPDLIILDIVMPEMDGYGFCKKLRQNEKTEGLPVIMITGGAIESDEAIEKTFEVGSTDFITKPVRSKELLVRVKSALILKQTYDRMKDELTKRKRAEEKLERLVDELKEALAQVKTLNGLLPICASCKKIRDDKGYWNQIEAYIQKHSDVDFTHSVCPECIKKLYPDLSDDI